MMIGRILIQYVGVTHDTFRAMSAVAYCEGVRASE